MALSTASPAGRHSRQFATGNDLGQGFKILCHLGLGTGIQDHLTIIGRRPEQLGIKGNAQANKLYGGAGTNKLYGYDGNDELYGRDGTRHTHLIEHQTRRGVIGTALFDQVHHILGITQTGQIRGSDHHHLVC